MGGVWVGGVGLRGGEAACDTMSHMGYVADVCIDCCCQLTAAINAQQPQYTVHGAKRPSTHRVDNRYTQALAISWGCI